MIHEKTTSGDSPDIAGNAAHLSLDSAVQANDGLNSVSASTLAIEDSLSSTTFEAQAAVAPDVNGNVAEFSVETLALGENTYAGANLNSLATDDLATITLGIDAFVA